MVNYNAGGLTQKFLKKLAKLLIFLNLICGHNLPKRNLNEDRGRNGGNGQNGHNLPKRNLNVKIKGVKIPHGFVTICQRGI